MIKKLNKTFEPQLLTNTIEIQAGRYMHMQGMAGNAILRQKRHENCFVSCVFLFSYTHVLVSRNNVLVFMELMSRIWIFFNKILYTYSMWLTYGIRSMFHTICTTQKFQTPCSLWRLFIVCYYWNIRTSWMCESVRQQKKNFLTHRNQTHKKKQNPEN